MGKWWYTEGADDNRDKIKRPSALGKKSVAFVLPSKIPKYLHFWGKDGESKVVVRNNVFNHTEHFIANIYFLFQ